MQSLSPDTGAPNEDEQQAAEVRFIARGLKSAMSPAGGLTELQSEILSALTTAMTGHRIDIGQLEPIAADAYAEGLADRELQFRTNMVQIMDLGHMILERPDLRVAEQVIEFATKLGIDPSMVEKARALATGSAQLVAADVDRAQYITDLDLSAFTPLQTADDNVRAWSTTFENDILANKWRELGDLEPGTLGRSVHDFYRARGFRFPGEPGSVPPLLAQHDWVHVLADYGSKLEAEIEVFAFMARASDDPNAFVLLGMAMALFHSGTLPSAAGFFDADPGSLSLAGMADRLADAFRRGAECTGSIDFLALDYFAIADRPLDELRTEFGLGPKSTTARAAGSNGPFEPGGISESQLTAGKAMAGDEDIAYDAFGAEG